MDLQDTMDLQNTHRSSLYIKAGRRCGLLLCLLLSASGLFRSGRMAGAENGAEIYRQYERSKHQADSSRNTVHALTAEIKKLNRQMIKEVGQRKRKLRNRASWQGSIWNISMPGMRQNFWNRLIRRRPGRIAGRSFPGF